MVMKKRKKVFKELGVCGSEFEFFGDTCPEINLKCSKILSHDKSHFVCQVCGLMFDQYFADCFAPCIFIDKLECNQRKYFDKKRDELLGVGCDLLSMGELFEYIKNMADVNIEKPDWKQTFKNLKAQGYEKYFLSIPYLYGHPIQWGKLNVENIWYEINLFSSRKNNINLTYIIDKMYQDQKLDTTWVPNKFSKATIKKLDVIWTGYRKQMDEWSTEEMNELN